jgi:hypothetical protein
MGKHCQLSAKHQILPQQQAPGYGLPTRQRRKKEKPALGVGFSGSGRVYCALRLRA